MNETLKIVAGVSITCLKMVTGVSLICASLVMPNMTQPKKEVVELTIPEVVELDVILPSEVKNQVNDNELTDSDFCNIAKMTKAEAGNQSELGKRLVIDTILNRVESPIFPNSVEGVLFQKTQFSPVADGSFDRATVDSDILELIHEELENRTDTNVLYFNARHYSKYGTPYLVEGAHYFSK